MLSLQRPDLKKINKKIKLINVKVGLFIPCYVDQLYPQVAEATLELLEKLGVDIDYPLAQTCCGQPAANAGFERYSKDACNLFIKNFKEYDYIVSPSGSCTYHVRHHYDIINQNEEVSHVRSNTYELCEFIVKVLKKEDLNACFNGKVGLHHGCHGLRGLRLGTASELAEPHYSISEMLLKKVKGLELMPLNRHDECCGFGGLFSINEEAVSIKMGIDRLADHKENGVQIITGSDMSCLMHLEGIIKRNNQSIEVKHIAEILNSK